MRLLVAGGRDKYISNKGYQALNRLYEEHSFTELVNGMASGIDKCARNWAITHNIPIKEFPAKWDRIDRLNAVVKVNKYGKKYNARAGLDRNYDMLMYTWQDYNGLIIVFPGGRGSEHMLKISLDIDANVLNWMNRVEYVK